jgi:hypothetical protein
MERLVLFDTILTIVVEHLTSKSVSFDGHGVYSLFSQWASEGSPECVRVAGQASGLF